MIRFTVPAVPVAQPRQRHAKSGHNYIPNSHPVHAFKASVRLAFAEHYHGAPLEGPLSLSLVCVFPRPGYMNAKKYGTERTDKVSTPDLDNVTKAVKDALKGLAWCDDSQVSRYHEPFGKFVASAFEAAHVEVEIREL